MKAKMINENQSSIIDYKKLVNYASGIAICCAGEYGDTFYNENDNHIWVCLGDSNPFDEDFLRDFMIDAISTSYETRKNIKITIENESLPPNNGGWKKVNK